MGFFVWMNLKGRDLAAFLVSGILGYLAGTRMPEGAWSVYTSILVSYHLFLAWLVIDADHEAGISLPIASSIITHMACLAVIVPFGMGRHFIPFLVFFATVLSAWRSLNAIGSSPGGGGKRLRTPLRSLPSSPRPPPKIMGNGCVISRSKGDHFQSPELHSKPSTNDGSSPAPRTGTRLLEA